MTVRLEAPGILVGPAYTEVWRGMGLLDRLRRLLNPGPPPPPGWSRASPVHGGRYQVCLGPVWDPGSVQDCRVHAQAFVRSKLLARFADRACWVSDLSGWWHGPLPEPPRAAAAPPPPR